MKRFFFTALSIITLITTSICTPKTKDTKTKNREKLVNKLVKNRFEVRIDGQYNMLTTLMCAILIKNKKMIELLLKLGANPNTQDYYGQTALMHSDDSTITKLLLEHNADPNIACETGLTPLMNAVINYDVTTIKLLLKHQADPYLEDNYGRTAFDYARRLNEDVYIKETVFNLLDKHKSKLR